MRVTDAHVLSSIGNAAVYLVGEGVVLEGLGPLDCLGGCRTGCLIK